MAEVSDFRYLVVPHTHWDREWYLPFEQFRLRRGMGDEIDDVGVVFRWRAGSAEVVACQMLPHYDNFARLTWNHDAEQRVRAIVGNFGEAVSEAGQDEIVLANGSDHLPIEPELPEIVAVLEQTFGASFRIGRYDEHAPSPEGLPVHEGELVGSRLQNVLRGVNSARIYLKQANERAERRLLSIETAAALRTLREDAPYPAADLRLAWRDLLRNHPHDSICGCSCDEVHRDMLVRYEQLDRTLDVVEREAVGVGGALVNTLPFRRRRGRGASREPVRRRPPSARASASACGLGRTAGADGAHARGRRVRRARSVHQGAAGVRGLRRRAAADAFAVRRNHLTASRD